MVSSDGGTTLQLQVPAVWGIIKIPRHLLSWSSRWSQKKQFNDYTVPTEKQSQTQLFGGDWNMTGLFFHLLEMINDYNVNP